MLCPVKITFGRPVSRVISYGEACAETKYTCRTPVDLLGVAGSIPADQYQRSPVCLQIHSFL
jgi:hypothetical protein